MTIFKCECGLAEKSGRYRPSPCQGCEVCETNYQGEPLEEHTPILAGLDEGDPYYECSVCGEWLRNA